MLLPTRGFISLPATDFLVLAEITEETAHATFFLPRHTQTYRKISRVILFLKDFQQDFLTRYVG